MAELLSELVAKITADATELEKGLSDAEKKTEVSSKKMQESLKKVGMAMVASGAAITAALGLMGKAAIDEEINIKHLGVALKGVGVNYDDVRDSLEGVIAATQRKTGIADNAQRDTLSQLILVTKDYNKALNLLPLALDLASYAQMDTRSAATYLAKAYEELEAGAERIGIRMGTTTVYFRDLNEVQKMVGGTAEAMVNPFSVLGAAFSDLSENIGAFLVPILKGFITVCVSIIEKVQDWAKEHPELASQLTILTGIIGGILTATGGLILLLPKLIEGYKALMTVINFATVSQWGFYASLLAIPLAVAGASIAISELTGNTAEMNRRGSTLWYQNIGNWIMKQLGLTTAVETTTGASSKLNDELHKLGLTGVELTETYEILSKAGFISIGASTILEVKELTDNLKKLAGASKAAIETTKEFNITTDGSKIPLATAIQKIGEFTYRTNLFSEAEITLAEAAGAKTERITQQTDAMLKDAEATIKSATEIDNLTTTFKKARAEISQMGAWSQTAGGGAGAMIYSWEETVKMAQLEEFGRVLPQYQQGGIVGETGLAYLHEGETVIPANESAWNVVVNFAQPVFFDREDTMNKFADMIRKRIQRQDRLRYGGAYSGG